MNACQIAGQLRFASALSTRGDTDQAVDEACRRCREQLGAAPDLAIVFVSPHHDAKSDRLAGSICDRLETDRLIGCTGDGIVGVEREVEGQPAISLWVARMPGAVVLPMHLRFERTPEGGAMEGWPDDLPPQWPPDSALLALCEPFSFPTDLLLERLNEDRPGVPVVGGVASGGSAPGENQLFLGRQSLAEGAVAVLLYGNVRLRTIVSQGCRPIGRPFVITKAERNLIFELGGKPALLQLKEVFDALPTREQQLVQRGLHVGRVVSEYQDRFEQGDFLVRNVMGVDPDRGAIAISDFVRPGQTVQFHIRDHETADEDLRQLLAGVKKTCVSAAGALLFTCNGRGLRLFPQPHHDATAIRQALGEIPLAGFFAQGELGPVGGQNFMHGFTASLAIFEER